MISVRRFIVSGTILILSFFSTANSFVEPARFINEPAENPVLVVDQYGYQLGEASPPPAFIEIAPPVGMGTKVTFSSRDDGVSVQAAIGFDFKFYEGVYPSVFIDTNGLFYFESQTNSHLNNHPLPMPTEPNNIISPLWTDLNLDPLDTLHYPSGEIYTYFHNLAGSDNDYFVIEWKQVYLTFTNTAVTFEVVLFPDGDIRFHYLNLPATLSNAVIGIENAAGDDGLMYWDGGDPWGLPAERVLIFERPAPTERGKLLPFSQGGFSFDASAVFSFTLINNGDSSLPASLYTIEPIQSDQNWTVSLSFPDGTPLPDAESDGKFETGPVLKGGSLPFRVHLEPPMPLTAGNYVEVGLRLATLDESNVVTATLQSAVPLPFAQVYYQPPKGLLVGGIWKHGAYGASVASYLAGNTSPSLARTIDGLYAASWSGPCTSPNCLASPYASTDIQLSLLNGEIPRPLKTLTVSNSGDFAADPHLSSKVYDPILAPASNGQIGIVWSRWLINNNTNRYKSSIDFALVDGDGELLLEQPVSLAADELFTYLPHYFDARLVVSENNHFLAFWLDEYEQSGSYFQRLYYRVVGADGNPLGDSYLLADSGDSGVQFTEISAALVNGDRAVILISKTVSAASQPVSQRLDKDQKQASIKNVPLQRTSRPTDLETIGYLVVSDAGGAPLLGYTPLVYGEADSPRLVQNESGKVLIAWNNSNTNSLGYSFLESNLQVDNSAQEIRNIDGRLMDGLSLTLDAEGDFILTAMNRNEFDNLYYAAISGSGELLTPRMMVYKKDPSGDYFVFSGNTGQQTAPYLGGYPLFLPQVQK